MHSLCLLHATLNRPPLARRLFKYVRFISCTGTAWKTHDRPGESQLRRTSLFDEIFPEEKEQAFSVSPASNDDVRIIPRLPLSSLDHFAPFSVQSRDGQHRTTQRLDTSGRSAPDETSSAILVFGRASRSLLGEDFCKVAPGSGDILKGANQSQIPCIFVQADLRRRASPARPRPSNVPAAEPLLSYFP